MRLLQASDVLVDHLEFGWLAVVRVNLLDRQGRVVLPPDVEKLEDVDVYAGQIYLILDEHQLLWADLAWCCCLCWRQVGASQVRGGVFGGRALLLDEYVNLVIDLKPLHGEVLSNNLDEQVRILIQPIVIKRDFQAWRLPRHQSTIPLIERPSINNGFNGLFDLLLNLLSVFIIGGLELFIEPLQGVQLIHEAVIMDDFLLDLLDAFFDVVQLLGMLPVLLPLCLLYFLIVQILWVYVHLTVFIIFLPG